MTKRKSKILQKGVAECIRQPTGAYVRILGDNFKIGKIYSFKKSQKKFIEEFIEYEIGGRECDAVVFKTHFIITKTDE